ncbi:MAG: hypothetical protein AAB473_02825 [Patescibacteria group bacterium]
MRRLNRENLVWGGIFLTLQALVWARNFIIGYIDFYWFCDFAPMVFAVFFFCDAPQGAKGLIHIGLLGQLLYTVSFLSAAAFGIPLFGFPIDLTLGAFSVTITFVMHQSVVLALFATRHVPAAPRSLLYSAIILLGVYIAVLSLADPTLATQENYNYIYSGDPLNFIPFYTELWIGVAMCVAVLPAFAFEKIPDALLLLIHNIRHRYAASS